MARDIERRLRALEVHAAQIEPSQGSITLDQWRTYCATGELPATEAAQQWYALAQMRQQQAAETMALFEDNIFQQ